MLEVESYQCKRVIVLCQVPKICFIVFCVKCWSKKNFFSNSVMGAQHSPYLDSEYEKELGSKLAVIEEIRSILNKQGIECPGVLVIGAQSSGKSSVLERLTGISFPRGENTCTRFPTIVQLQTDPAITSEKAFVSTCAEFTDAYKCNSLEEIQNGIRSCTETVKLDGLPIADKPIHVRYIRRNGPVMTLIDLPGITHVDAENQTFDIHAVTAGMVESYVNNENMVVLVVIPANDDFGNSEALRIAQTFDKEGNRTIGVVSKCDLVPDSSDVVEKIRMVREADVKLALGFIAVRNKGPKEENIDIEMKEKELFLTHKVLKKLNPLEWGYKTLSKKIVQLQSSRVTRFIPEVQATIRKRISLAETELKRLGFVPSTSSEMRSLLTSVLASMEAFIIPLVRAESYNYDINIASKTASFAEEFATAIKNNVPDFLGPEYFSLILGKMKKSTGYSLPNFIGDTIFRNEIQEIFFRKSIPDGVLVFIDKTTELMENVFKTAVGEMRLLAGFPSLASTIIEECCFLLYAAKEKAIETTLAVLHCEESQVFTLNQDYIDYINKARDAISQYQQEIVAEEQLEYVQTYHSLHNKNKDIPLNVSKFASREKIKANLTDSFIKMYVEKRYDGLLTEAALDMQISIQQYSEILLKRLFDIISMLVRSILVFDVLSTIHVKVQMAVSDETLSHLLLEHESILRKKTAIQKDKESLQEAQRKLRALR